MSGNLLVDDSRLAYFGKTENNSLPRRLYLDVPYTEPTVKHLFLEFKDKAAIHYCIPVKRRIITDDTDEDNNTTEPKPTTTTLRPKTAGKKYLSISKKKNKRQRSNTCPTNTKEPTHNPQFDEDGLFVIKGEPGIKDSSSTNASNVEGKQSSNNGDIDNSNREEGNSTLLGKRKNQGKLPGRFQE